MAPTYIRGGGILSNTLSFDGTGGNFMMAFTRPITTTPVTFNSKNFSKRFEGARQSLWTLGDVDQGTYNLVATGATSIAAFLLNGGNLIGQYQVVDGLTRPDSLTGVVGLVISCASNDGTGNPNNGDAVTEAGQTQVYKAGSGSMGMGSSYHVGSGTISDGFIWEGGTPDYMELLMAEVRAAGGNQAIFLAFKRQVEGWRGLLRDIREGRVHPDVIRRRADGLVTI